MVPHISYTKNNLKILGPTWAPHVIHAPSSCPTPHLPSLRCSERGGSGPQVEWRTVDNGREVACGSRRETREEEWRPELHDLAPPPARRRFLLLRRRIDLHELALATASSQSRDTDSVAPTGPGTRARSRCRRFSGFSNVDAIDSSQCCKILVCTQPPPPAPSRHSSPPIPAAVVTQAVGERSHW